MRQKLPVATQHPSSPCSLQKGNPKQLLLLLQSLWSMGNYCRHLSFCKHFIMSLLQLWMAMWLVLASETWVEVFWGSLGKCCCPYMDIAPFSLFLPSPCLERGYEAGGGAAMLWPWGNHKEDSHILRVVKEDYRRKLGYSDIVKPLFLPQKTYFQTCCVKKINHYLVNPMRLGFCYRQLNSIPNWHGETELKKFKGLAHVSI